MALLLPLLNDLVKTLTGNSATSGWDIVCSYSLRSINSLLNSKYSSSKLVKEVKISETRVDPKTQKEYLVEIDVVFGCPEIGFNSDNSGNVTVQMPIMSGNYSVTPTDKSTPTHTVQFVGNTNNITGTFPLAAVDGITGTINDSNGVAAFTSSTQDICIAIQFNTGNIEQGAFYKLTPEPNDPESKSATNYFLNMITAYFTNHVNILEYGICNLNNIPNAGAIGLFTPRSFIFTTNALGNSIADGILNVYIQTAESGSPVGNLQPNFIINDVQFLPIPQGYSAAVLLSYDLITKCFIQKKLEEDPWNYTCTFNTSPIPTSGISLTISKNIFQIATMNLIIANNQGTRWTMIPNPHPTVFAIPSGQTDSFPILDISNDLNFFTETNFLVGGSQTIAFDYRIGALNPHDLLFVGRVI